jgi:hypothetical protein
MREQTNIQTKTNWAIVAAVAIALIGIAAPLAFADNIGAPTSAAGGLSAPSSPSLSGSAGPLGSSHGGGSLGGGSLRDNDDSMILKLQPGTGKFEGRDNGSRDPCIGSSGFGSSGAQPGHKC